MNRFTYQYKGAIYEAGVEIYMQEDYHLYRVYLPDGLQMDIGTLGIRRPNDKIIWLQSNKPGEIIQPHDLPQAIGEGLEKSKLYYPDFQQE